MLGLGGKGLSSGISCTWPLRSCRMGGIFRNKRQGKELMFFRLGLCYLMWLHPWISIEKSTALTNIKSLNK